MASYAIKRLSPALGAEITGIDLHRSLTPETVTKLRRAWLDHLVLVVRGQDIGEPELVRFAAYFGEPVGSRSTTRRDGGDNRVMLISNIRKNGEPIGVLPDGELMFHADSVFLEKPLMGSLLHAREIPAHGGHTLFSNMYLTWDSLPDDVRNRLATLEAVNVYDYSTQVRTGPLDRKTSPHAIHPAVRRHPETGRLALHVNRLMTEELIGITPTESTELLEVCFAHVERPEHIYKHVWQVGDLVMWDNRCTQHARTDFPATERRLLRRVGLEGDRPFP